MRVTIASGSYVHWYLWKNIGTTHVFHALPQVPRKLFEHEADRRVLKHLPRDSASVNAMKHMCDRYSCIFYLIPTKFTLKMPSKHSNIAFLILYFSKQNGVGCMLSNVVITVPNVFSNKNNGEMISLVRNTFCIYRHVNNSRLILSIF